MDILAPQPDAPFRSGISGKYKLLITGVLHKFGNYEYDLLDCEGKEYKAVSKHHYAEGQILRCMVSFTVSNARLVVTDTTVCNKQDFATLIPEPPKPQPHKSPESKLKASKAKPKDKKGGGKPQPNNEPKKVVLGDPRHRKTSGTYVFKVAHVEQNEANYSYLVEGARSQQYEVSSKVFYAVGTLVDCKAKVTQTPGGLLKVTVQSIREHVTVIAKSTKKHKKSNPLKHWHAGGGSRDWFGGPNVGDHFHLIYTPMGNKR